MTFGNESDISWGDDDFSQAFFFQVPVDYENQVFIRVFDPDIGGSIDEIRGNWNTQCQFEVYGGEGCHSEEDARETSPFGNYKSGTLLDMKVFGESSRYDESWYTFGPFNPAEGEALELVNNYYVFKVICEGITGDDGNMFRYFLSTSANENIPIEGANAFAYEYSFRMHNDINEVSHIYPYIAEGTLTVQISNFDWDNDGNILVVSRERQGQLIEISNEADWVDDQIKVFEGEVGLSYDLQMPKRKPVLVRNNNVVVNVRNQYDETMPFYTSPIGGVPKYKYSIIME